MGMLIWVFIGLALLIGEVLFVLAIKDGWIVDGNWVGIKFAALLIGGFSSALIYFMGIFGSSKECLVELTNCSIVFTNYFYVFGFLLIGALFFLANKFLYDKLKGDE